MPRSLAGASANRRAQDKGGQEAVHLCRSIPLLWLLVAIILLATLSLSDGLFTLYLIEHGATEENPIMAWFLSQGAWPFMIAKFFLTSFAIIILLVFHNYYFRPLRIQVKTIFPAFLAVFLAVLAWQLFLNILIN